MPLNLSITYPGFTHKAEELSAYTESLGIFIIGLVNKKVVTFEPADRNSFERWLKAHNARDIRMKKPTF